MLMDVDGGRKQINMDKLNDIYVIIRDYIIQIYALNKTNKQTKY